MHGVSHTHADSLRVHFVSEPLYNMVLPLLLLLDLYDSEDEESFDIIPVAGVLIQVVRGYQLTHYNSEVGCNNCGVH